MTTIPPEIAVPLAAYFERIDAERAAERDRLHAELSAAAARETDLAARHLELQNQLAAAVHANHPMRVGACPRYPAGVSLKAAQSVIDTWGKGAAVRQFFGKSDVAPRPADASLVHASWKVGKLATLTDAWFLKITANLLPGDCVEAIHEGNSKVALGTVIDGVKMTRPVLVALKNRFYDLAKKHRPDLLVVNTLTVWEAVPANPATKGEINAWAEVKADLLGIDMDGIVPRNSSYHDFMDAIGAAAEFVARNEGYSGWCVPEFGSVLAPDDPTGEKRAVFWIPRYLRALRLTGNRYVCAYEYEPDKDVTRYSDAFEDAPSYAAWKAGIA